LGSGRLRSAAYIALPSVGALIAACASKSAAACDARCCGEYHQERVEGLVHSCRCDRERGLRRRHLPHTRDVARHLTGKEVVAQRVHDLGWHTTERRGAVGEIPIPDILQTERLDDLAQSVITEGHDPERSTSSNIQRAVGRNVLTPSALCAMVNSV